MFLLTVTKKGFPFKEIQKQLGLKRYETVWAMVDKPRKAMGNRDEKYTLESIIEFNEGYFTVASTKLEQKKGIRRRGTVGKKNVAISAESTPLENIETGEKSRQCRYFKVKVLETHMKDKINKKIKNTTKETLKCVHITISNAKRNFLDNYHQIKGKYLQLYLNEFIYKLNRRYFCEMLFDRLVITSK